MPYFENLLSFRCTPHGYLDCAVHIEISVDDRSLPPAMEEWNGARIFITECRASVLNRVVGIICRMIRLHLEL